jgi:hypothetical protein
LYVEPESLQEKNNHSDNGSNLDDCFRLDIDIHVLTAFRFATTYYKLKAAYTQ